MSGVLAQGPTLSHGPLVGGVTDTSAVVWMRASDTTQVLVRYSTDPNITSYMESFGVTVDGSTDFSTKIEISGLTPETVYYLDIMVDGVHQLSLPYPRFKTFPTQGVATPFKFVILNDFRIVMRWDGSLPHAETFASANSEEPDFVIIGGDFDHSEPQSLEQKRGMFKNLYSYGNDMDDFVNLVLRHYPVAHVWDDHDYGPNNGDKTYPDKELSLAVLDEFFPVYSMTQYGCWQRFSYGQADFFLLDSRSQRDPNTDPDGPDKSMLDGDNLGEEGQLEWLLQGLAESTATWKFVKTPSVFNGTNNKEDSWISFQTERQLLLDFIESNDIQGVVLISGDFHFGAIDDGTNSGLPEMLVPTPNLEFCRAAPNHKTGYWSEGVYTNSETDPTCWGYGLVTVLTDPDRIVLEVKDALGNTRVSYEIPEMVEADFTASPTEGAAPLTVSFTNLSEPVSEITSYLWDFGDGVTSTITNPAYIYGVPGSYTVTLTAFAAADQGTVTKTNFINVSEMSDFIFGDGFESGDLSAWSEPVDGGGDLNVSSTAALVGTYGMQMVIDDNTSLYVRDETPSSEPHYRARFYFDPNSITMEPSDSHYIFAGLEEGVFTFRLQLRYLNDHYQLTGMVKDDASSWNLTSPQTITDESHYIEIEWKAASAQGANDGHFSLWIDGVLVQTLSAIDNDTRRMDEVWLGPFAGIDSGTRGTYHFDTFESRRETYIGAEEVQADFSAAPTDGIAPLTVSFTNLSEPVSEITSYLWEFGDGVTSTITNPVHIYFVPGSYSVSLTAFAETDQDTVTKVDYIEAQMILWLPFVIRSADGD